MTNEEAKAFLDNLKICINEHPIVADWLVEIADRKTEPQNYCDDCLYTDTCDSKEFFYACTSKATISKMEQVDKDINVRSKDERQTEGVWNAGYKTGYDKGYKDAQKVKDIQDLVKDLVKAFGEDGTWLERQGVYTLTLAEAKQRAVDIIESVLAKDEPTTQTGTQNSNLTFKKRTMRDCYNCKRYETEDECIECHYEPKDEPQDECAKEYEELGLRKLKELRNDEPQTYVINPQEPTNDDKCFECDDFFTCGGRCNKAEDEPQTDCAWK